MEVLPKIGPLFRRGLGQRLQLRREGVYVMRILNRRQLETWDLSWPATEPGPWLLTPAGVDAALVARPSAIGVYWIGSSPTRTHTTFRAKYCGKAVNQPLRTRLTQHASGRGNLHVAQHLRNKRLSELDPLWFRFVEFPTRALVEFTEGTMISAFRDDYIWNSRNEFKQQWALERL